MAITRKLYEIRLAFNAAGDPTVDVSALVSDDVEGTSTGMHRQLGTNPVLTAAASLRDAVLAAAQNAGKPLTF